MPFKFPDNIPSVAKNWEPDEQRKCIAAANKMLADGKPEQVAIFACIAAAGKSEDSADVTMAQVHVPAAGETAKVSKSEANYRKADGPRRCANCRFFVKPASCRVVAGSIAADFTSDKYKPLQTQAANQFLVPFAKALRDDILIFPVGKFYRDGQEREFTLAMGAQMVANFRANILERKNDGWLPINAEHMREHGRLGDIVALYQDDLGNVRGKPHAPDGKLDGFDYFSPEVRWQWTHPTTGKEHTNVLMGGGATNYPFFLGKMALQGEVVPVLKSADLPLVWSGSEWEVFNMDELLSPSIVGRMLKTAIEALGKIHAMARGGQEEAPDGGMMPASEPEQADFTHTVQFAAADTDHRILTGVVWEPDALDMHGHTAIAQDIEAAAHDFMSRLQLDAHHDRLIQSDEVRIVESWIQREPVTFSMRLPDDGERVTEVKPGSWCMSVKVLDDELWSEVQGGDITGFSPVGQAIAQELQQNA